MELGSSADSQRLGHDGLPVDRHGLGQGVAFTVTPVGRFMAAEIGEGAGCSAGACACRG